MPAEERLDMPRLLLARVLAPLPTPLNASDEREREEEELRLRS